MTRVSRDAFGNPGSRHAAGRRARKVLEESRETIAAILDARPEEVLLTSGGTESINLAIFGLLGGRPGEIVTLPGEHPATEECLKQTGRGIYRIPIDVSGRLVFEETANVDWSRVSLATTLLAHNETGVIQDLSPIAAQCREQGIPWHVDAVQAVGKIDVSFQKLGPTALSLASHKFHGPRGVGALLLRAGTRLVPRLFGGHQEKDLRPGTEPVALAAGMALALKLWLKEKSLRDRKMQELRDLLEAELCHICTPVVLNGSRSHRLPNTISIAFPGCEADALLVALDLEGICCSHGSACSSGSTEPAPVLGAMGLLPEVRRSTLRISVSCRTTEDEVHEAIQKISRVVNRLRNHSRTRHT